MWERVRCGKELDARRLWGVEVLCDICLSFVSMRVPQKGKGDTWKRMDLCGDRLKDRRITIGLFIVLSLLLI